MSRIEVLLIGRISPIGGPIRVHRLNNPIDAPPVALGSAERDRALVLHVDRIEILEIDFRAIPHLVGHEDKPDLVSVTIGWPVTGIVDH